MTEPAQLPLVWSAAASDAGKRAGMTQAADNHASLLAFARGVAVEIAVRRFSHEVTADDVARELEARGISVFALGNAAGSLFKGGGWAWTGRFMASERVHAHRNLLRVWRWVGE